MKKTILDEVVFILFYFYLIKYYVPTYHRFFYGKDREYRASQTLKRHLEVLVIFEHFPSFF